MGLRLFVFGHLTAYNFFKPPPSPLPPDHVIITLNIEVEMPILCGAGGLNDDQGPKEPEPLFSSPQPNPALKGTRGYALACFP